MLIVVVLVVALYPLISLGILLGTFQAKDKPALSHRLQLSLGWPLVLLSLNESLPVGGMDNPILSWITRLVPKSWRD
ncbi:MAG TPA: hypothetical protein VNG90_05650 [Candidatus Acidoferrum sp.]|nr:hypothetical protein [Candidatus Acidoferrum sp.]